VKKAKENEKICEKVQNFFFQRVTLLKVHRRFDTMIYGKNFVFSEK